MSLFFFNLDVNGEFIFDSEGQDYDSPLEASRQARKAGAEILFEEMAFRTGPCCVTVYLLDSENLELMQIRIEAQSSVVTLPREEPGTRSGDV